MRVALAALLLLVASCAFAAPEKKADDRTSAVAKSVCDTLQALPEQRREACCHRSAGGSDLSTVCVRELQGALARGAVKLETGRAQACATATNTALDGCGWVGPLLPQPPAECGQLIDGTLAAGATCRSSLECGNGLHCKGVTPGGTGVCAEPTPVGKSCENPADNLVSLTRAKDDPRHPICAGACVKGLCLALIDEGASCPSTAACKAGLHCISGTCTKQALPKLGETCSAKAECGDGSVCSDGKCIKPKDGGESCKLPFECRSMACDKAAGAATGTCTDVCT